MTIAPHKRDLWHRPIRQARACVRRLRRDGAALAVLLVATLGLGEPLLCILHCQIWLPAAYSSYFAAQHQHMHHHMAGMAMSMSMGMDMSMPMDMSMGDAPAGERVGAPAPAQPPAGNCFTPSGGPGVPFHIPPSPIHDLIPALILLILVAQRAYRYSPAPPGAPASPDVETLLRPPILRAI